MFYYRRPMTTARGDVDAAVAGLRARWGAAAPGVVGALALAPEPADGRDPSRPRHEPLPGERVIHTGFAALDAILGPGGLPSSASVAHPRRRLERPDDARPAGRRGGPGAGLGRGLAGPVAQLRPGRGGRPRRPPRMARGHHAGQPRRGPVDRRQPARRPVGRPARPRPARRSTGADGHAGEGRRPAPSTRRARPARGDPAADPRCARARRRARRPRSTSRPASGSSWLAGRGSAWVATSSASAPRRSSPTTATVRRAARRRSGSSTPRAASGTRASPTTPCSSTRSRAHPRPRIRGPRSRDPPCDDCTCSCRTSPSTWRGPDAPSPSRPARSCWAASRGIRARSSTPARTPERSASGAGCRSGAPIDSSLRRPSSTPIPMRTGQPPRPCSRRSPGSARASRGVPTRRTRRSGCSRSASTAWGRCGVPSRCSSSASAAASAARSPGRGVDVAPRVGIAGTHFAATIAAIAARPERRSSSRPATRPRSWPIARPAC